MLELSGARVGHSPSGAPGAATSCGLLPAMGLRGVPGPRDGSLRMHSCACPTAGRHCLRRTGRAAAPRRQQEPQASRRASMRKRIPSGLSGLLAPAPRPVRPRPESGADDGKSSDPALFPVRLEELLGNGGPKPFRSGPAAGPQSRKRHAGDVPALSHSLASHGQDTGNHAEGAPHRDEGAQARDGNLCGAVSLELPRPGSRLRRLPRVCSRR